MMLSDEEENPASAGVPRGTLMMSIHPWSSQMRRMRFASACACSTPRRESTPVIAIVTERPHTDAEERSPSTGDEFQADGTINNAPTHNTHKK
jgi:hypothetical protein